MASNPLSTGSHSGEVARDPFTEVQIRIGVMGSAGGDVDATVVEICRRLGRAIAQRGCCLLTGECPGLPHEVVLGARAAGGHVVGISPVSRLKQHVETFRSPYREYDVLVFTALGLMGRELVNIHSSDIVVSGRSGTLGEFAIRVRRGEADRRADGDRRHHYGSVRTRSEREQADRV